MLIRITGDEEIVGALGMMSSDKATGPNSLTAFFYKSF